jgi:hypothetical protein
MAGCRYCHEMHSSLYVCDEQRAARARAVHAASPKPTTSPKPTSPKSSSYSRNAKWREKHPDAYRAYMRSYMAKRAAAEGAAK